MKNILSRMVLTRSFAFVCEFLFFILDLFLNFLFGFSGIGFCWFFLVFWIFVLHLDIGLDHDVKMHKIPPCSFVIRS